MAKFAIFDGQDLIIVFDLLLFEFTENSIRIYKQQLLINNILINKIKKKTLMERELKPWAGNVLDQIHFLLKYYLALAAALCIIQIYIYIIHASLHVERIN